jgi:hypothetical protein
MKMDGADDAADFIAFVAAQLGVKRPARSAPFDIH